MEYGFAFAVAGVAIFVVLLLIALLCLGHAARISGFKGGDYTIISYCKEKCKSYAFNHACFNCLDVFTKVMGTVLSMMLIYFVYNMDNAPASKHLFAIFAVAAAVCNLVNQTFYPSKRAEIYFECRGCMELALCESSGMTNDRSSEILLKAISECDSIIKKYIGY